MNTKSKMIAIGSALIMFLAAMLITKKPQLTEKTVETPSPQKAIDVLSQKLAQLGPQTREASDLRNTIAKVRSKGGMATKKLQPGTENPGALIEAFASLKTKADGTSYKANYKVRELKRALKQKSQRVPLPWVERGPGNVSGRARAIVVDPGDPSSNTWFVASIGGGIWKTSDGGISWQNKTPDLTALTTTTLAMCAGTPEVMYAGTGMGYGRVVEQAGSGIWKTTDRGETWFQLQSTANGQLLEAINRMVVDPSNPNLVLACSNDSFSHLGPKGGVRKSGIFRSTDGGTTWNQVFDPDGVFGTLTDNRVQQIVATPGNFNVLYAAVNEVGVIKSTNRGLTWTVSANNFALPSDIGVPTGNGVGLAGISVRSELAVSPSDPNRIYAAVERPRGTSDLYMSTNAGASWSLINDTGNDPNWFSAFGGPGPNNYVAGWFDNTIAVHPYNPNIVFVGGVNLYRLTVNPTLNNRTSALMGYWLSGFGVPQVHADHHWLEIIPVNQASNSFRILNANDGGVAVSNDGGNNWARTQGMITTQFYGADKKPGEDAYIGGTQDNGTWLSPPQTNLDSVWSRVVGGDGFESVWNFRDPKLLLGGSQNGNLSRSEDGGFTWSPIPNARAGNSPFISKIANSKTDPDLVFTVGSAGVNRSDDFGKSWNLTPITGNWLGYRPFDNVEISDADPRFVWISSRLGIDPPAGIRGGIHVSSDSGLSFSEISQQFPAGLDEASGMATHPQDPQTAYVLFSLPGLPKVLRTNDLGQTWVDLSGFAGNGQPSSNGFPDVAVFSLLVMPYDTETIWAGTEIGLVISEDGGQTWSFADNGMPHVAIFQMKVVDDQVVVATMGRGVWSVTLPELDGYQPPKVTLVPRLNAVSQNPEGNAVISLDLRSPYDRTEIWINGEQVDALVANDQVKNATVLWPVVEDATLSVSIMSYRNGVAYQPPTQSLSVTAKRAQTAYVADFDDGGNPSDFSGNGFSITTPLGFFNGAIHSPHPYTNSSDFTYELRVPLIVPENNAILSYDNVVLVEPGGGSGIFGDPNFFDFVIAEGTRDGAQWIPLAPGYDSRANSAWLAAYNAGSSGSPSLFIHQDIDIGATFQPGELIFIRFRLNADPGVTGWGWAIDNLEIFADQVAQDPGEPIKDLIYPWISQNENFESVFVINNFGAEDTTVTLTARRELGIGERLAPLTIPANGFIREKASELFPNILPGAGYTVLMASTSPFVTGGWVTNNLTAITGASPSQGVAVDRSQFTQIDNNRAGRRMLFGYLPVTDGFISAPVVVNTGTQATNVTLSFYDEQGTLLFQDSDSLTALAPSRPFARVANTLLPDATGDVAMIAESTTQPISGVGFVFNEQGETAIGNATSLDPSENDPPDTNLLYAWISNNEEFESIVIANNTTDASAQVTLIARRANGDTEAVQRTVQGRGFLKEAASSLFPGLGDGSGYTVQCTSPTPGIKGRWVTNNLSAASGRSPSQGVAVTIPGPGSQASQRVGTDVVYSYLPLTGGTISAPVVVNVSDGPVNIVLDFYNAAGQRVLRDDTTLVNLEPLRPFATVANTLIAGVEEDVYMIARSSAGLITGVSFVFNEGLEPAIGNVTSTAQPQ